MNYDQITTDLDHRLLHGQVVFSWSKFFNINRIIVANDEAANDEFKKMSLEFFQTGGYQADNLSNGSTNC